MQTGKKSMEVVMSGDSKDLLKSSDDEIFGKESKEAVVSEHSKVLLKSSDDEVFGKKSMEAVMSGNGKVLLKSSDDQMFDVDKSVAIESVTLKHMIEDTECEMRAPLPYVNGKTLALVIDYCKYHVKARNGEPTVPEDEIKQWDANFANVDQATLFDLILAADYLNITNLLDLTSQCAADMIKDKTPEEIRKLFHITNDFTPEEEAEVRKEIQWAFE